MTSTIPTTNHELRITAAEVHETLGRHMLVDGMPIVFDLERSHGSRFVDARSGKTYLDFFSFFASSPIGLNHPKMLEASFLSDLTRAAINKPSNSDVYSREMAEFVDTFGRIAMPDYLPHLFLIEGGALAVENTLKAAFDWKIRKNLAKGKSGEQGTKILHFRHAFHGRSGYTLSLTNTDPIKTMYFPKFDWPRVDSPYLHFPLDASNVERALADEARTIEQIKQAFATNKDEIAAIIIEPIQAEGGDRHFRPEFLQQLRTMADENEALLIFDEVQTGVGMTGKMWAHEWFVEPDLVAFGKKTQVCGFMGGRRIEEVRDNVYSMSSRINSTWGGNLADMVRAKRYFEIIAEEGLVENSLVQGAHLLKGIEQLAEDFPDVISEPRGRGLLCAFDLADGAHRDQLRKNCFDAGLILLGCGDRSIRFRTALNVTEAELDEGLSIIRSQVELMRG